MTTKRKTATCKNCSVIFSAYRSHREPKYCSSACYDEARTGAKRGHYSEPQIKQCVACQQEFYVGSTRSGCKIKRQKYCSNTCKNQGRTVTPKQTAKELGLIDLGYLTGFMDGEGTISLQYHTHGIRLRVSAANTHRSTLERIKEITGVGAVFVAHKATERSQESYTWSVSSRAAYGLLQQMLPYLQIKREQAELCISAYERLLQPHLKFDKTWQQEYLDKIAKLNSRGAAKIALLREG